MKQVDAILTADLHLSNVIPVCRTDNYLEAQTKKLQFITGLQQEYQCPVLVAGDIFNKSKSSPEVESLAIREMPHSICIPGQHDLPDHNIKNYEKSSLNVLEVSGKIKTLLNTSIEHNGLSIYGFAFGTKVESKGTDIALVHQMVHEKKAIHESINSVSGLMLLKRTDFKLIVCGDNHKPFTVTYKGRLLVNCGSMMRTTASQTDYKPSVWLWNSALNEVEQVFLPIEEGVVSRDHLEAKEAQDKRMTSFVESINPYYEIGLSFHKNIEFYFNKNKTRKGIKDEIYESMEG